MFPEAFPGALGVSLIGAAWREQALWRLETVDIRGFSKDKRGFLDDAPRGRRRGAGAEGRTLSRRLSTRSRAAGGRFCA